MSFTENGFAKGPTGDILFVRKLVVDGAGRRMVSLMRIHDSELYVATPEHDLINSGFVPMALIEERVGPFKKARKPMFRRNDWVWHRKSDGIYNIVGLPTEYFMERTGEPAYVYMNNEGIRIIRSQQEMEDGRFQLASKAELDKRRLGTAYIPRY